MLAAAAACFGLLSGCAETIGPLELEPVKFVGGWLFRAEDPSWCDGFPASTIELRVDSVSPSLYGRMNLAGTWEIDESPAPHIPKRSRFTGSMDRSTGQFEVVLWTSLLAKGVLAGTFAPSGEEASASVNWGVCRVKRGRPVAASG